MDQLIIFLVLLGIGYGAGRWAERSHLKKLGERERAHGLLVTNLRTVPEGWVVRRATLVHGQAVISSDYFKTFVAYLVGLVGGELRTLETLVDRARREATLRAIESAREQGANALWNIRYETSDVARGTGGRAGLIAAEVFAWGTALWVEPAAGPER